MFVAGSSCGPNVAHQLLALRDPRGALDHLLPQRREGARGVARRACGTRGGSACITMRGSARTMPVVPAEDAPGHQACQCAASCSARATHWHCRALQAGPAAAHACCSLQLTARSRRAHARRRGRRGAARGRALPGARAHGRTREGGLTRTHAARGRARRATCDQATRVARAARVGWQCGGCGPRTRGQGFESFDAAAEHECERERDMCSAGECRTRQHGARGRLPEHTELSVLGQVPPDFARLHTTVTRCRTSEKMPDPQKQYKYGTRNK